MEGPGDLQAIYREHFQFCWHTLRRLGVPSRDLPDVTHDVFLVVHRRLSDFEPGRPLKPWLFGIAYRVALDRSRKFSTHRERIEEGPEHKPTQGPKLRGSVLLVRAVRLLRAWYRRRMLGRRRLMMAEFG